MLDELKLAENVEEIDLSIYVEPVKPKSAGAVEPVGAMCATSLVIKYARRLVSAFLGTPFVNFKFQGLVHILGSLWFYSVAAVATKFIMI